MKLSELDILVQKAIVKVFTNQEFKKMFYMGIVEGIVKNKTFINEIRKLNDKEMINEKEDSLSDMDGFIEKYRVK